MLKEIKSVRLLYYQHRNIEISLPTHHNKHSKIFNSYKYDISGMVYHFLKYKVKSGEIKFIVNNEIIDVEFLHQLEQNSDHLANKKLYTKLSGLLVKEDRMFYQEYLHSSIRVMEDLLNLNRKLGLEFKILKIFVDEIIVDKPLLMKNVKNEYGYNFNETYFKLFVKSLPYLKKQIYITESNIELNHSFVGEETLITDLNKILDYGIPLDMIHTMTSNIINGTYSVEKLIQFNEATNKNFIKSNDNIDVPIEFIPDYTKFKYFKDYYYKIYQDIASNLIYVKGLK